MKYYSEKLLLHNYRKLSLKYKKNIQNRIQNLLKLQRAEKQTNHKIHSQMQQNTENNCSICKKSQQQTELNILGNDGEKNIYICEECFGRCQEMLCRMEQK